MTLKLIFNVCIALFFIVMFALEAREKKIIPMIVWGIPALFMFGWLILVLITF